MSRRRREELEDFDIAINYCRRIKDFAFIAQGETLSEPEDDDLPF